MSADSVSGLRPHGWMAAAGLAGAILLSGCSRSAVPVPEPETPQAGATELAQATGTTAEPLITVQPFTEPTYAVVWVAQQDSITVRQPAGISSVAVDTLAPSQRGIRLTGKTTLLGSSQWVEIYRPTGETGWVNGWNLTEQVEPASFCSDLRVLDLLARLNQALTAADGPRMAELVSPRRGLIVRHDFWNPEVRFEVASVASLFEDHAVREWGIVRDSQLSIVGTFRQVILPRLEMVFNAAPEVACNHLGVGVSAQQPRWPYEYGNLNFYSFYRRAPEPGNRLSWNTWAVGVEYVGGEPYVAILVHYQGEI